MTFGVGLISLLLLVASQTQLKAEELSCHGYQSCTGTQHSGDATTVNCGGYESCLDATFSSNKEITTLKCNGFHSCFGSALSYEKSNSMDQIDCGADNACSDIVFTSWTTDAQAVHCNSYFSCQHAKFYGTVSKLTCNGYYSCFKSVIYNMDSLVIAARFGCMKCRIQGITDIVVYGDAGLYGAHLISGTNMETMTLTFYGYKAATGSNLLCNEGVKCVINCMNSHACYDFEIYSDLDDFSNVEINCNNDVCSEGDEEYYCPELAPGDQPIIISMDTLDSEPVRAQYRDDDEEEEEYPQNVGYSEGELNVIKTYNNDRNERILNDGAISKLTSGMSPELSDALNGLAVMLTVSICVCFVFLLVCLVYKITHPSARMRNVICEKKCKKTNRKRERKTVFNDGYGGSDYGSTIVSVSVESGNSNQSVENGEREPVATEKNENRMFLSSLCCIVCILTMCLCIACVVIYFWFGFESFESFWPFKSDVFSHKKHGNSNTNNNNHNIDDNNDYISHYLQPVTLAIISKKDNANSDDIQCFDYQSCANSVLAPIGDLYCVGEYACSKSVITSSQEIECGGSYGCYGATITHEATDLTASDSSNSNNNNHQNKYRHSLKCNSEYSCAHSSIAATQDELIIQCAALHACSDSAISSYHTIYAHGIYSLQNSKVLNVKEANCGSQYSCDSASIVGKSDGSGSGSVVYCHSEYSCANAKISQVRTVVGYSTHSMQNAVIDSDGEDVLNVYLYSHLAGDGLTVECRAGSTCNMYCESDTACENVVLNLEDGATYNANNVYEDGDGGCYNYPEIRGNINI